MDSCYGYLLLPTKRLLVMIVTVGLPQQADDFFCFVFSYFIFRSFVESKLLTRFGRVFQTAASR